MVSRIDLHTSWSCEGGVPMSPNCLLRFDPRVNHVPYKCGLKASKACAAVSQGPDSQLPLSYR